MKCNVVTFTAPTADENVEVVQGILTSDQPPCPDDPPPDPPPDDPVVGQCDVFAYQVFHYKLTCDTRQWIISALEEGCIDIGNQGTDTWQINDRFRRNQYWFNGEFYGDLNVFFPLYVTQEVIDGYPLWVRNAISSGLSTGHSMDGFVIKHVKGYLCSYGGMDQDLQMPICYPTPSVQSGVMNTPITDMSNPDSMAFSLIELGDFGYPEFTPLAIQNDPMGDVNDYTSYSLFNGDMFIVEIVAEPQNVYVQMNKDYSNSSPSLPLYVNTCGNYYITITANVGADIQYSAVGYYNQQIAFQYTVENIPEDTTWTYIGEGGPHYIATESFRGYNTPTVANGPTITGTQSTILRKVYQRRFKIQQRLINEFIGKITVQNNNIMFVDEFFELIVGNKKPPKLSGTMTATITATWSGGPGYLVVNGITGVLRNGIPKISSMPYGCNAVRKRYGNGDVIINDTTMNGQKMYEKRYLRGDDCYEGPLPGIQCSFTYTHKFSGAPLLGLATKSIIHNWRNNSVFLDNYGNPRSCGMKRFDPGRSVVLHAYGHHRRSAYNCFNGEQMVTTVYQYPAWQCLDENYPNRSYSSCILGFGTVMINQEIGRSVLPIPNDMSAMPKNYSITIFHQGVNVTFNVSFEGFHSNDCFTAP